MMKWKKENRGEEERKGGVRRKKGEREGTAFDAFLLFVLFFLCSLFLSVVPLCSLFHLTTDKKHTQKKQQVHALGGERESFRVRVILISSSLVLKTKIEKAKKEQRKKKQTSHLLFVFSSLASSTHQNPLEPCSTMSLRELLSTVHARDLARKPVRERERERERKKKRREEQIESSSPSMTLRPQPRPPFPTSTSPQTKQNSPSSPSTPTTP
jgi:hypothetical protein